MRTLLILVCLLAVGCTCQTDNLFREAWDAHIQKTYNWVFADNEAAKYKEDEAAARAYLQEIRGIENLYAVSTRLKADGFHWHEENIDFTSYAWVTIARKRGDCDDFMLLWEEIVKFRGGTSKRITVTSTDGRAHAMLFFYMGDILYLLSNMDVMGVGKSGDEENLVKLHYGDKTRCWIAY